MANDRLSPVLLKSLKEFIAVKESEARGRERIQVEFSDSDDYNLPNIKAFHGKWIFSPSEPLRVPLNDACTKNEIYCIAVTGKDNVVVHTWTTEIETKGEDAGNQYTWGGRFLVFSSFEEAARNDKLNHAIREAIRKRGVPVEELDI